MRLLFVLLLLCLAVPLRAQEWESLGGERFTYITAADSGALLMISEPIDGPNALLRSGDRGETWQVVYRARTTLTRVVTMPVTTVHRLSEPDSIRLLVSDTDVVAESRDNGRTWTSSAQRSVPAAIIAPRESRIGILSECTLDSITYECGEGGMLRVTDNRTRVCRMLHNANIAAKRDPIVQFVSKASGVIAMDSSVFITRDSAVTWRETFAGEKIHSLLMLTESSWMLGMAHGIIATTTNSGESYLYDTLATSRDIISISWRDKTFDELSIATDSAVYSARISQLRAAWVAWDVARDTDRTLLSVSWPNRYVGYVVFDSLYHLDSLAADWDGIIRDSSLVRHIGIIQRSTDGGANWVTIQRGQPLRYIHAPSSGRILACGARGNIYKSDDSGSTSSWFHATRTQDLNAVQFLSENTALAVGDSGVVLLSQNPSSVSAMSGRWWRPFAPVPLALHPATRFTSLSFPDARSVVVAGDDSAGVHLWRTAIREAMPRMSWHRGRREPSAKALSVYPNPATSVLHVEGESGAISLLDEFGQTYPAPMSDGAIDISNLSPGVYFVTDGKHKARFVKE